LREGGGVIKPRYLGPPLKGEEGGGVKAMTGASWQAKRPDLKKGGGVYTRLGSRQLSSWVNERSWDSGISI